MLIAVEVAVDGRVDSVRVVNSSGYAELDAAAVVAAQSAEFHPAESDGRPVAGRLQIPIVFSLR